MSLKAKDLSYESKEPSFLRKLRDEVGSGDPHRHERPVARPTAKGKLDEDDGPTYVIEGSNENMSKDEFEALTTETPKESTDQKLLQEVKELEPVTEDLAPRRKQLLTEAGKSDKKRKAGKVLGTEPYSDESMKTGDVSEKKKPKVMAKAIKLSFGNEE